MTPTGAGSHTARRTAEVYRTLTLGEYIGGGFQGWRLLGVAYTGLETGVLASGSAVMNGVFIGVAWEAGVAVGSALNVAVGTVVAPEMLNYVCFEK